MEKMQSHIKQIIDLSSDKPLFTQYTKAFYSQSLAKDFSDYSIEELRSLVCASFNFFYCKPQNGFKIRLYNPTVEEDGFTSDYTILDIVNDDMPFLVDSVVMQFDNAKIDIKNIIHPIYSTKRFDDGNIKSFSTKLEQSKESVIQLHLSRVPKSQLGSLEAKLTRILETVRFAVQDWREMVEVIKKSCLSMKSCDLENSDFSSKEVGEFIDWVINNQFIFLGSIEFDIVNKKRVFSFKEVDDSRLGTYKSDYDIIKPTIVNVSSEEISKTVQSPYLIEILKSRYKSQIHRYSNAERIRIQKFNDKGEVVGEYRFIGLFASSVYYQNCQSIPIIRKKIDRVIKDSGFSKNSCSYKDLISVLESYPRDELFQITYEDLLRISTGIVAISGRSLVRIFTRYDKFSRFVSCIIFVPRDHFSTELREKIQSLIEKTYCGITSDVFVQIADTNLTRLHLVVRTDSGIKNVDVDDLEKDLVKLCRLWIDDFKDEVYDSFLQEDAKDVITLYYNAFSVSYTNRFSPKAAVYDAKYINQCLEYDKPACDIYNSFSDDQKGLIELKIYSPEIELELSDIMPILDSFGFNVIHEHTYCVSPKEQKNVWIHYFRLKFSHNDVKLTSSIQENFVQTVSKIWSGETVVGDLNRLIIAANLKWRKVFLIRAYNKYLHQIGFRYSQSYIASILVKNYNLTQLLVKLFDAKFNPQFKGDRLQEVKDITFQIDQALNLVEDISEDKIIRGFVNIVESTIRTNFYQKRNGDYKDYVSFKIDSSKVNNMPLPVMYAEIFVYSAKVEGIHLRGGKVARGGLRWSDRHEDFRTEILGLVKAQMTKNAVIVPVGSKGGFVVRKLSEDLSRDQIIKNGIECYQTFLRGLLDVTDNVVNSKVLHPKDTIRYDNDDPYLVVAADKGTATFSDIANEVSDEYNFWLGDAFASGGSVGYDHKKMGITARGAWISVQKHFSEIGIDIQNQDFTCVGIGDMCGDVFGNGMLLSRHTKLIAAFNHMHIFIDPNPDIESSYKERERMFLLPRSSWEDYDASTISKGGGIYGRNSKSIALSKEAKDALSITQDELNPNELISAILKSSVDLIWNGGIGTYFKGSDESHMDVGDRINDILRVDACEMNCKVVGEGGNLGLTQKARIEASLKGVAINTDAMDNSAGVDCSDHEVNIKIALTAASKAGKISIDERNAILESMTDEVAELVLRDNEMQTSAVTTAHSQGYSVLGSQKSFLNNLEKSGMLNRKVEFLPENKEIIRRQSEKIGMTRPELCVMLSYSKMDLYQEILNSNIIKDKYLEPELFGYFPQLMKERFKSEIENHQLRDEIIATQITNAIVDKAGMMFINQITQDTGFAVVDVVKSYIIVCDAFDLDDIWKSIRNIDPIDVSPKIISKMLSIINKLLERGVIWMLRNNHSYSIGNSVLKYQDIIKQLFNVLDKILASDSKKSYDKKLSEYSGAGVHLSIAKKVASMDPLASVFDIEKISNHSDFSTKAIAKVYFEVGTRLNLKWIRGEILKLSMNDHWQKLSMKTILEDLYNHQMKIANQVVDYSCSNKSVCVSGPSVESWIKDNSFLVKRYDSFISDLKGHANLDLSMFVVALNRIRALVS